MSSYVSLGKYTTFSDNRPFLRIFLSGFLTFLILSYSFSCFYSRFMADFKISVSLADKYKADNMKKITIANVSFPPAEKVQMAKDLAREVGYIYIDSGAMYRAVTLYSIENGIFNGDVIDTEKLKEAIRDIRCTRPNPETGRPDTYLNRVNVENKIRTMGVSSKVSPISALDFVREAIIC